MFVSDCISAYRVIVRVKRADEHNTVEVKYSKRDHSAELGSCFIHFGSCLIKIIARNNLVDAGYDGMSL